MLWQFKPTAGGGGGVTDHGALTGLADDDHTQYHTDARGDVRYNTKAEITTLLSGKANTSHTHVAANITDFNAAALAAAPAETVTTDGARINGAASKTTPVDADHVGLMDSASSNVLKKLSWANIKATLKTYFDTLYAAASHSITGHSGFPGGTTNFLRADGTFAAPPGGGGGSDGALSGPDRYYAFNDWTVNSTTGNEGFVTALNSSASHAINTALLDGGLGWLNVSLGANVASGSAIHNGLSTMLLGNSAPAHFKARVRQRVLSEGVNARWVQRMGFSDGNSSLSGEPTDGVYFRYSDTLAAGNWQAVCRNNGVETGSVVDTGVAVAIDTTYILDIVVNAAGTSAEFRINGTLVATITTNIPTGAGRECSANIQCRRSVGSAAVATPIYSIDYIMVEQTFTGRG